MSPETTRSQRKRVAILKTAMAEFQARGFRETSMDRIAERAKVSKRTVYNHFGSKEELFKAITGELVARLNEAVAVKFEPGRPLRDQLHDMAMREVDTFLSPDFVGMSRVFVAETLRSPELVRSAFASDSVTKNSFTAWVREAVDAGALAVSDPEAAAHQLVALLKGPLFWPVVMGIFKPPPAKRRLAIVEQAVGMFLAAYAPGGPQKARST
ncbi:MAG: TetR/AcrR family transcriptional regulator [bacterium]|nr:TetR/AcrR family transcriptional regulator [bacterium]